MKKSKIQAHQILRQIQKRHADEPFFTEVKNGSTWFNGNLLKVDALAFKKSWANPCITAYEVKVDRNDFLRDEKWPGYKNYCNRLYFACPRGLIKKEELSDYVGLIYYNPDKDTIYTRKQALFREIEPPVDMFLYLILSRYSPQKEQYPFFNSRKEFFKEWLENKRENIDLGVRVRNRMTKIIMKLEKENNALKGSKDSAENYKKQIELVKNIMRNSGISFYDWNDNWLKHLNEALKIKVPPQFTQSISNIEHEIGNLKSIIK